VLADVTLIPIASIIKNNVTLVVAFYLVLPFVEIVPDHLQSPDGAPLLVYYVGHHAYSGVTP